MEFSKIESDNGERDFTLGESIQKLHEYDKGERYQNVGDTRHEMSKTLVREFEALVNENAWRIEPWYIVMYMEKEFISARALKVILIARTTEPHRYPNLTCYKYTPATSKLELLWTQASETEEQFFIDHKDMFHPQILSDIKQRKKNILR